MPRRKPYVPRTLAERNQLWQRSALPALSAQEAAALESPEHPLPARMAGFLNWFAGQPAKRPDDMYCFILYDIETDKVRRVVARYLEKQGCIRVQKSVFFARFSRSLHQEVLAILRRVQPVCEPNDTILVLPVGEDMLNRLTCIGKHLEFELMTAPRTTLFF